MKESGDKLCEQTFRLEKVMPWLRELQDIFHVFEKHIQTMLQSVKADMAPQAQSAASVGVCDVHWLSCYSYSTLS